MLNAFEARRIAEENLALMPVMTEIMDNIESSAKTGRTSCIVKLEATLTEEELEYLKDAGYTITKTGEGYNYRIDW